MTLKDGVTGGIDEEKEFFILKAAAEGNFFDRIRILHEKPDGLMDAQLDEILFW